MSRHTFLLGVAIVLLGCGLALTHELLGPWPGVNERNVRRIRKGMCMQEVEAILGGPGTPRSVWCSAGHWEHCEWTGPRGHVGIFFELPDYWRFKVRGRPTRYLGRRIVYSVRFTRAVGPHPLACLRECLGL